MTAMNDSGNDFRNDNIGQYKTVIMGVDSYLPQQIVENKELEKKIDTSDEWIRQRTGIFRRHIAAEDENTSSLAIKAAQNLINQLQTDSKQIDLVIVATSSPDNVFPATATRVQQALGIRGAAFDVQAVCAGFIYALVTANSLLSQGLYKRALVIGADLYSRFVDWSDRNTCILFGDGAGAILLDAVPIAEHQKYDGRGYIHGRVWSDGAYYDSLYVDGGPGSSGKTIGKIHMNGKEVFKHAVNYMSESMQIVLKEAGLDIESLDWLAPHQANIRIMKAVAEKLEVPDEKVFVTVQEHANIAAATIPVALHHGVVSGKLKQGDIVGMTALGGGFAWGAAVVKW